MLFNSIDFVVFFPAVVALYFALPHRARWAFLLAASYYFYACWKLEYLALILVSTLIDYAAGLAMARRDSRDARRPLLLLSLASNLGILFFFKYADFFGDSVEAAFRPFNVLVDMPAFEILLPVGISFYTFQTLAYSIDVYRGRQEAERHLGLFALYVCFWPQLVAGPIERSQSLLPQFRERHPLRWSLAVDGLKLMAWGFFMKLVVADRAALYVGTVYANPEAHTGWPVILATFVFGFQIYCDFAGYSNVAIGAAQVMGYRLMENFRRPFLSRTLIEFWGRWHISLTTWFRDYLYFPMGGSRVPPWQWAFNSFFVFAVCGLWHGASWTFVSWGVLHGAFLAFAVATRPTRERLWQRAGSLYWRVAGRVTSVQPMGVAAPAALRDRIVRHAPTAVQMGVQMACTFSLIVFVLVFFRAASIGDAFTLIQNALDPFSTNIVVGLERYEFFLLWLSMGVLVAVELLEEWEDGRDPARRGDFRTFLKRRPVWLRYPAYALLVLSVLMFGEYGAQEFIYFQF